MNTRHTSESPHIVLLKIFRKMLSECTTQKCDNNKFKDILLVLLVKRGLNVRKLKWTTWGQRWEVIKKGFKKRKENTLSNKKNKIQRKNKRKKTCFQPRKKRKQGLDQEKKKVTKISTKKENTSFKILLFFFYKFPPQIIYKYAPHLIKKSFN